MIISTVEREDSKGYVSTGKITANCLKFKVALTVHAPTTPELVLTLTDPMSNSN